MIPTLGTCGDMISAVVASGKGAAKETDNPWTDILPKNRQKWLKKVNIFFPKKYILHIYSAKWERVFLNIIFRLVILRISYKLYCFYKSLTIF